MKVRCRMGTYAYARAAYAPIGTVVPGESRTPWTASYGLRPISAASEALTIQPGECSAERTLEAIARSDPNRERGPPGSRDRALGSGTFARLHEPTGDGKRFRREAHLVKGVNKQWRSSVWRSWPAW